ncbi:hypothetical protein ACROYT_G007599 [Oculina patagonica]
MPGGSSCSDSADKRNYCPGPDDENEHTHCCVSDSQPTCCLPGGSSCRDSADKRNYCPRPDDENEQTHCCVSDSQPTCCLPGGSSCSDSADKRNYCPGPNDGSARTHRCVSDSQPTCCLPGDSSCSYSAAKIRNYCPGPGDGKDDRDCCLKDEKPACCRLLLKLLFLICLFQRGFKLPVPTHVAAPENAEVGDAVVTRVRVKPVECDSTKSLLTEYFLPLRNVSDAARVRAMPVESD